VRFPWVLGGSGLVLLACLGIPRLRGYAGANRHIGMRGIAGDPRLWLLIASAAALQASHQVYYGFGTLYWRSLGFSEKTIGFLWAEGVLAEILLFWQGRVLLARFGPAGLMILGGVAGILRWSLAGVVPWLPIIGGLQLLHALTFGASHLGAMHFLSRTVPPTAAASAQSLFAAMSSGIGGLVMLGAGALYAAYGGGAYLFMAAFSAAGLLGALRLRLPAAG
jgi:MFS transporter, PPP family, 3-phenylpropionic acid transporter